MAQAEVQQDQAVEELNSGIVVCIFLAFLFLGVCGLGSGWYAT